MRSHSEIYDVEKGFNSDVIYRGMNFHVQTEDWGLENPYLVSRVYQNGAVVKSVKTPYTEVLGSGSGLGPSPSLGFSREWTTRPRLDPEAIRPAIRLAIRDQHQRILDLLMSGQLF